MTIQVGDKIPSVVMHHLTKAGNTPINSDEILAGKKVIVFSLTGAFTPTCSASHLPGYVTNAEKLFAKGIDSIVCLAVNDAWVMDAWGQQHNAEGKVMMVADGSGYFTSAIGLELNRMDKGMGMRSRRYAMVVNDGIVEQLNLDADMKFEVSDAETILGSL